MTPGLEHSAFNSSVMGFGPFLGLASLIVLAVQMVRLPGDQGAAKQQTLYICIGLAMVGPAAGFILKLVMLVVQLRYDPVLLAADGTFGFQPSFAVGRFFASSSLVRAIGIEIYYALLLPVAINFALHSRYRKPHWRVNLIGAYAVSAAGSLLYFILPAAGPQFVFGQSFPNWAPAPAHLPLAPVRFPTAPPNAIPSLHAATAMLVWWNVQPWKHARLAAGLFLLLTLVATLGTGEHYMIDLIVAAPFAVLCQAIATRAPAARVPLISAAAMTAVWISALRFVPAMVVGHSVRIWLMALCTVAVSFLLGRRLENAGYRPTA
jgi:hypothetical protein